MRNPTRVLIAVAVLILLGAALFWIGLSKGRSQLETERQSFNAQLQQSNAKAVSAEYNARLTQARFLLCRTAVDLDQRNFGLAQTHLKEAEAALRAINPGMVGIDAARFEALLKDISGTNLNVAINLEEQRNQVLNFSTRLEDMMPRPAPAVAPQPAAPAATAPVAAPTTAPAPAPAPAAPAQAPPK